jgi:hypothetical protein
MFHLLQIYERGGPPGIEKARGQDPCHSPSLKSIINTYGIKYILNLHRCLSILILLNRVKNDGKTSALERGRDHQELIDERLLSDSCDVSLVQRRRKSGSLSLGSY